MNFSFNKQFWFFGKNFLKKGYSASNRKQNKYHHWILHIRVILGTRFQLKLTILIFCTKFAQEVEIGKSEQRHWILHIRISPGTNQISAWTDNLFSWTKFYLRYFWSETENVNIIIEFCIFELVWVPNFILNKQFWILGPNLPKRRYFRSKLEFITIEFCLFKLVKVPNFNVNWQFWFFGPKMEEVGQFFVGFVLFCHLKGQCSVQMVLK